MPNVPLQGIRVVDASTYLSGPFAGLMLADLGADVIKVEPPAGDPLRRFDARGGPTNAMAASVNRNKRSIALDLKVDADRDIFLELVGRADVLLHNWRESTERSLRLRDGDLARANPRLVRVAITGYGPSGPYAGDPAFDSIIQAYVGLYVHQGKGGAPEPINTYVADKTTSLFAVQGVVAALYERERRGHGARVDVPMLDALAYFSFPDVFEDEAFPDVPRPDPPLRTQTTSAATLDGRITLAPGSGRHVKAALDVVGHPEWKDELLGLDRADLVGRLLDLSAPVLATRVTAEWLDAYRERDVPAAPVLDLPGHLGDGRVLHNQIYSTYQHPRHGTVRAVRYPVRFGDEPAVAPSPYPDIDGDRDEVREELRHHG